MFLNPIEEEQLRSEKSLNNRVQLGRKLRKMVKDLQRESYKELNRTLIDEIRDLETLCNKSDNTQYQLFLENTLNADRNRDFVYLYRHQGRVISFLLLFFPQIEEIEVYGFTHPDYRCSGLFRSLIKTVVPQFEKSKSTFLFVCDPSSTDGMAFLKNQGRTLRETEYMMELNWSAFDKYIKNKLPELSSLEVQVADLTRLDEICPIASHMYGEEKEKSSEFVRQTILSDNRDQYIALLDKRIIGICTLGSEEDYLMINGLAISRDEQGKGYGRIFMNILLLEVKKLYNKPLKLEVSSVNDRAYKLYKSLGFEQKESYGYFY
jgi:ribosomal protein S18 acetylase RimI-like enzyme